MSGNLIAIIVILVLLLVLAGIIYYAYCNIRKTAGYLPDVIRNGLHD